jgi:aminoglycoside phosphotransferase (APT) family kinase protein
VFVTETRASILGSEFVIMQNMPGHTLGEELMAPDGRGATQRLKALLPQLPAKVSDLWTTMAAAQFRLHQLPVGPLESAIESAQLPVRAITLEGRLDSLRMAGTQRVLTGLEPVIAWLEANRPFQNRVAICHCDFQPFNVLVDKGRLSGVLDWATTMIGDPAMDVGFTVVAIAEAPVKIPRTFAALVRFKLRAAARAYCRSYRRLADLDKRAVDYYRVFACTSQLRWACQTILRGHGPAAFASVEGVARLVGHIEAVSGIRLSIGRLVNSQSG